MTLQPDARSSVGGGQVGVWMARATGDRYVGGELALETYTSGEDDFSVSYHALVGLRSALSEHVELLADAGAGLSQQVDAQIGILGGKSGFDTRAVEPSGAVRLHLALGFGAIRDVRYSLALTSDARTTLDGDAGIGVGLGVLVTH